MLLSDEVRRWPHIVHRGTQHGWADKIQKLESENAKLREAILEALPECWDTPKAERILKEAMDESQNAV